MRLGNSSSSTWRQRRPMLRGPFRSSHWIASCGADNFHPASGLQGTTFTSEILLLSDGRFLYAANRLHDTIAIFSVGRDGRLTYSGETSTMGDYPRHIQFDPSGAFLYSCNQRGDSIASFRVDRKTGQLTFTGQYTPIGSPACIVFPRR
jgi:6-phosphogluconolactonase